MPMGLAAPPPTLDRLRQSLAGLDPSLAPRLPGDERLLTLGAPIDRALGGGLAAGALHEMAPVAPVHLAAAAADLTATRRLSLAAREGAAFGLLLRHRASPSPSAAATRWQIAASPSRPDAFGGLGPARFDLTLCKNRRGPSGRWIVDWDHHE